MAKPRVFVSSTYYDLKHVRASLDLFIESLGFESVLSEKGDIAYAFDQPLDESCYREVSTVDIFVLLVGGRYGHAASSQHESSDKRALERYDSITKREFQTAVERDVPIYILVEKSVYAEYQTFKRNRDNGEITYAHVDSTDVFRLVDEILSLPRNNPVQTFERFGDIEEWLRSQWAGNFREMLQRKSEHQQLRTLTVQVDELREVTQTLKSYLETVMRSVSPDQSGSVIREEDQRLKDRRLLRQMTTNPAVRFLSRSLDVPAVVVAEHLGSAKSVAHFLEKVIELEPPANEGVVKDGESLLERRIGDPEDLLKSEAFIEDIYKARDSVGLSPLPRRNPRPRKRTTQHD